MNLDPLTFAFEVLNFWVLLWLLQRFLYKPVREAIHRRQAAMLDIEQQAIQTREQALQLQAHYQQLLAEWHHSEQLRLAQLEQSVAQRQEKALLALAEQSKAQQAHQLKQMQQQAALHQQQLQAKTRTQALSLASHVLTRLAGEKLDALLLDMLLEDLPPILAVLTSTPAHANVESARPLSSAAQQRLRKALQAHGVTELSWHVEPALQSGLNLTIGSQILHASLRDELTYLEKTYAAS